MMSAVPTPSVTCVPLFSVAIRTATVPVDVTSKDHFISTA